MLFKNLIKVNQNTNNINSLDGRVDALEQA